MGFAKIWTSVKMFGYRNKAEIELVAGLLGIGASYYFTRKAAKKEQEILAEKKLRMDKIKEKAPELEEGEELPEEESKAMKAELTQVYVDTTIALAKAYAPAVICGSFGLGGVLCSHKTLKTRMVSAMLTAESLRKAWNEYRGRVAEEVGAEKESEIFVGGKMGVAETVDEEGTIERAEAPIFYDDDDFYSPYAFELNKNSRVWLNSPSRLCDILEGRELYWTRVLRKNGCVTLYEVVNDLDGLKFIKPEIVPQLMRVGWVWADGIGSGEVKFNLREAFRKSDMNTGVNYEFNPILDFNIDGDICALNGKYNLNLFGYKNSMVNVIG